MDRAYKILILMLITSYAWAEDIHLTSDYVYKKPAILSTKTLTLAEQVQVKTALSTGRRLIHSELTPIKNDYQNDFDRGTVAYTPNCRNYSYQKVVVPDGVTIKEANFSQRVAHTQAISGKNLNIISCNLVNVEIDPTWKVSDCNTCQIQNVIIATKDIDGGKELTISHRVEDNKGIFKEVSIDKEICSLGDDYNLALLKYQ